MKIIIKTLILLFLIGFVTNVNARQVRVSVVFLHYSVGNQIVFAEVDGQGLCQIVDTMTITYLDDTANIVFRDYNLNYWNSGPLSDTIAGCVDFRFPGFNYDLITPSYNRVKIWNSWDGVSNQYAGFVDDLFQVTDKENQRFWQMFLPHNVPGTSGDSVAEFYDVVMVKNPFICWSYMTQSQADSIQRFYSIVRDSVANHPEVRIGLVFGTPRVIDDTVDDSTQAKITYNLLQWFNSEAFFTHTNAGTYKNLWKFDSYSSLMEMSVDSANRYCLKNEYAVAPGNSHLSVAGSLVGAVELLTFIRQAAQDVLIIKSGTITREEIDLKIKQFRDGGATEQEVLDLIQQYNIGDK